MTLDRLFIEQNRKSLERMNALATRLTDEELQAKVGEHWTVAIVYAHLAFWERRVLYILETTKRDGKVSALEIDIVANDLSLPLWAAIPARDAVRIALESAEAVDRHLEGYPQSLL
jgi:hypothetical protein